MSIIDVLYQQEFWIGQDGLRHDLTTMHQEHRLNLRAYLERHAERLAEHRDRLLRRGGVWHDGRPVIFPPPDVWVRETPFYRALEVAIALHDAVDGEVVANAPEFAARMLLERGTRRRDEE